MCTNPTERAGEGFQAWREKERCQYSTKWTCFFPPLEVPSTRDCVPISVLCTQRGRYTQARASADRGINHTRLVELKTF